MRSFYFHSLVLYGTRATGTHHFGTEVKFRPTLRTSVPSVTQTYFPDNNMGQETIKLAWPLHLSVARMQPSELSEVAQ